MKAFRVATIASLVLFTTACGGAAGNGGAGNDAAAPESLEQRASYAIGFGAGEQLSAQDAGIDIDQLVAGLRDAFAGNEGRMTAEERQASMMEFQQAVAAAETERRNAEAAANREAGDAFLAQNAGKPNVVVLESGLQYEVLQQGNGVSPLPSDEITAHYTGRLIDGTVFDSSVEKGTPMTIRLSQLVPGMVEGMQLMRVGSKHRLYIPGDLGYGARGAGGLIGPNATLIFEVELLAVNGQS